MSKLPEIKKGDYISLNGFIEILEDGTDQTANEDFTQWKISCDVVGPDGVKVLDVPLTFNGNTPVYTGGVDTTSLQAGTTYRTDVRFMDGLDRLASTSTISFKVIAAISEIPA